MQCVPKVLILEDERLKYDLYKLLKADGFYPRIVRSVNHLVSLANEDHYDASIIDIKLSKEGTEGLEAIRKLRSIKPNMYLEVLTAYREFEKQALELGADTVSFKPGGINGLGQRIKCGMLDKSLSNFSNELGISKISMDRVFTDTNVNQSPQVVLNLGVLTKCATDINSFLDSYANNLGVNKNYIEHIKSEIVGIMINQLTDKNFTDKPMMEKSLDPQLANNVNYSKFIELRSELQKKYLDMYVAFVDGKFFSAKKELMDLLQQLDISYAQHDAFIKKISMKEKVITFNRPRKIIKN
jgi:ActR/RegA family two-component response regulator